MTYTATRSYGILLVEDDAADAMLIQDALLERPWEHTITQVEDGVAALRHLNDPELPHPDLILMDLNMPRMNGRELLAVLKADQTLRAIPVVVLTTSAAPDDVSAAYQSYANAYITKPVNLDDFVSAVQSVDTFFLDTAARVPREGKPGS